MESYNHKSVSAEASHTTIQTHGSLGKRPMSKKNRKGSFTNSDCDCESDFAKHGCIAFTQDYSHCDFTSHRNCNCKNGYVTHNLAMSQVIAFAIAIAFAVCERAITTGYAKLNRMAIKPQRQQTHNINIYSLAVSKWSRYKEKVNVFKVVISSSFFFLSCQF